MWDKGVLMEMAFDGGTGTLGMIFEKQGGRKYGCAPLSQSVQLEVKLEQVPWGQYVLQHFNGFVKILFKKKKVEKQEHR